MKSCGIGIDRVTMVLPMFALSHEAKMTFQGECEQSLTDRIRMFDQYLTDFDIIHKDLGSTKAYKMAYELKDGVNFQFAPNFKIKRIEKKIPLYWVPALGQNPRQFHIIWKYEDNDYAIRIEFNPNKVFLRETKCLIGLFSKYFPEINFKALRFNRLDVNIDFATVINPRLFISRQDIIRTVARRTSGIETLYLGNSGSDFQFRIYNKAKELWDKEGIKTDGPLWRVELQISKKILPSERVGNYFKKLKYIAIHNYDLESLFYLDSRKKRHSIDEFDIGVLRLFCEITTLTDRTMPEIWGEVFGSLGHRSPKSRKFKQFFDQIDDASKSVLEPPHVVFAREFDAVYDAFINTLLHCFYCEPEINQEDFDTYNYEAG